jgi:hypothetical protein
MAAPPYIGSKTSHHDYEIAPVSFRPMNNTVSAGRKNVITAPPP